MWPAPRFRQGGGSKINHLIEFMVENLGLVKYGLVYQNAIGLLSHISMGYN